MRKPLKYEYYLLSCLRSNAAFTDQGYRMPIWLADEMRIYRQMYELYQLMDSYRNGYTISVNALKRFQKARESLYANGEWISPQMARMVQETILKISELYSAVLDHYDTKRTVQIKGRSDRHVWDETTKEMRATLDKVPDIEWRARREMASPSPVVLVKELWK